MPPSLSDSSARPPSSRKRFPRSVRDVLPLMALGHDGSICSTTRAARTLLEYPPDASMENSFFVHVHPEHRPRVMRDLADMVSRGKRHAQWLLRLRTGHERWRWYRASAQPDRIDGAERILVHLRPL